MDTLQINGKSYYTVKQFADITNRTEQTIRKYITYGNKIRRLKALKVGHTLLVPTSELTDYPFTICGNNNDSVYHFNELGKVVNEV